MAMTALKQDHWKDFFDTASRAASDQPATVEVVGLSLGDRLVAQRVPLMGASYEPRGDVLTLFLKDLEHRIRMPRQVHAQIEADGLRSLEVVDAEGLHHIVQLEPPLPLPAAILDAH